MFRIILFIWSILPSSEGAPDVVSAMQPTLRLENGLHTQHTQHFNFDENSSSGFSSSDHYPIDRNNREREDGEGRENEVFSSSYSTRGRRRKMEDFHHLSQDCCFAGVFDGHGGAKVSKYIKQTLYSNFLQLMPENKNKWYDKIIFSGLKNAVKKVDSEVTKIKNWDRQGSTLSAIYINREKNKNRNNYSNNKKSRKWKKYEKGSENEEIHENGNVDVNKMTESNENTVNSNRNNNNDYSIITVNVGDSRIVLARGGKAIDLTSDHKPNSRSERSRIRSLGGTVLWHGLVRGGKRVKGSGVYRVNRNLSLSRAIGDKAERPCVTSQPDLRKIRGQHTDEFIVLATDGLWDVLSSQEVVTYVRKLKSALENEKKSKDSQRNYSNVRHDDVRGDHSDVRGKLPKLLVREALRRGSSDNITVIIQWLK